MSNKLIVPILTYTFCFGIKERGLGLKKNDVLR